MCKLYQVSTQEPVRFKNLKYTYKCLVLFHTVVWKLINPKVKTVLKAALKWLMFIQMYKSNGHIKNKHLHSSNKQ